MANLNFKKTISEINAGCFEATMGGRIPRIEIANRSGKIIKTYDWSANPVKNRIVQTGKDAFYGFGGRELPTSDQISNYNGALWRGSELPNRMSLLQYCARGTGTAPTTTSMTALQNKVGDYTSTIVTGANYTGSGNNAALGLVVNKVRFSFPAGEAGSFTEVGFFGNNGSNYVMFSRVLLPSRVDVAEDQIMFVDYEIIFTFPYSVVTRIENFDIGWGSTPVDVRIAGYFPGNMAISNQYNCLIDSISTAGISILPHMNLSGNPVPQGYYAGLFSPEVLCLRSSSATNTIYRIAHQAMGASSTGNFPNVGAVQTDLTWSVGGSWQQTPNFQKFSYTKGTNKMTKLFTWQHEINQHEATIGYWNMAGMGIKMVEPVVKRLEDRLRIWADIHYIFN